MQVIAFIGSSKLKKEILALASRYERQGNVCIMSHIFSHADGYELTDDEVENALINGHVRIDMCDRVILVKKDGHVGRSTMEEKRYAYKYHKPVQEIDVTGGIY